MTYPATSWRILVTPPAAGAWNMAVDEALLIFIGSGKSLPTLRLYAWEPPCLSLGYAQTKEDADRQLLNALGWHLVRRPTGGKAILHIDELTYSVIAPLDEPRLTGGVLESYRRLSDALLAALLSLGIAAKTEPHYDLPIDSNPKSAVCFEIPSNYEITAGGKKLIGSAQARRREGILQHGTLPLHGDIGRITLGLSYPSEVERELSAQRVRTRATTVESVTGAKITWQTAADAFQAAFSRSLGLTLISTPLSTSELAAVDELVMTKYSHPTWTDRI